MDYFVNRRLTLVRDRLEATGRRSMTFIIKSAMDPTAPPQTFRLAASLGFDDMEAARRPLIAHGPETQADIPNFTDVAPAILIGEAKPA